MPAKLSQIVARALLRFHLAERAFTEADSIAEHILTSAIRPETELYQAAVAGLVVSYCRPYTEANGVGRMPDEMTQFGDTPEGKLFRVIQETLWEARNKQYAHFDRLYQEALHEAGEMRESPSEITFDFFADHFEVSSNVRHLNPELIPSIRKFFRFQRDRANAHVAEAAIRVLKNHGALGKVVLQVP